MATNERSSFEIRLEGGNRFFMHLLTPPLRGQLTTLRVPDFFRAADFLRRCEPGVRGVWDLWPIDESASRNYLNDQRLYCRTILITRGTPGVAILSFADDDYAARSLWLQIFLSTAEIAESGLSIFEDWLKIIRPVKDDRHSEAVLRLGFADISAPEIERLKGGKSLITTDITLSVQPRAFPLRADD